MNLQWNKISINHLDNKMDQKNNISLRNIMESMYYMAATFKRPQKKYFTRNKKDKRFKFFELLG